MPSPTIILYAEDDNDDFLFVEQTLKQVAPQYKMIRTRDGQETVELLERFTKEELPSLVILDYNMPRWNALKTLEQLQTHKNLKDIPIIIYSNGSYYKQIEECIALGAQSYIQKGNTQEEIKKNVQQILSFIVSEK